MRVQPNTQSLSVETTNSVVAVTRGTDPHLFLLQALAKAGLSEKDIKPVLLQHPDGGRALQSGQVDAWAGLDPHMAQSEIEGLPIASNDAMLDAFGVDSAEIARLLAAPQPEQIAESLIAAAMEKGAPDNVTVVIVRFVEPTFLVFSDRAETP